MYYVYILKNQNNELYYSYTKDLKRRFLEHNQDKNKSTKNQKWKLIYYETYLSEEDARNREHQIKYHGQAKRWLKERLKKSLTLN